MKRPRDFYVVNRTGLVRFARVYSNVVSPPVMFAVLGLIIALWETRAFLEGLAWAAVYGFWVSLAPILFIVYLLKTGRIAELHMSDTSERHLPYLSGLLAAAIALGIVWLFDGPEQLRCLIILNIVELIALASINIVWLISLHSAGALAVTAVGLSLFGLASLWITLPMTASVVWVRLYLKRHTLSQVIAGLILGASSVLLLRLLNCF